MKIRVVKEKCAGHARCWAQSPEIYDLDDEGYILDGDIDVPEGQERAAWLGAKSCPERALVIEDYKKDSAA
ncbi:ferredoxin [Sphingomonas montanisoli]|uniref:Ferredoxin n=1 Tax=Sphingomonas montanisoli TaxID=2606412 RepID=A0A5D9C196_9SPHN|nr:ferredoxin [Sphingomonas montanisoli]TZG24967.1 ferredoxin [Sphingomonas montanisoli]